VKIVLETEQNLEKKKGTEEREKLKRISFKLSLPAVDKFFSLLGLLGLWVGVRGPRARHKKAQQVHL